MTDISDGTGHGIDAHVPSEAEQFEQSADTAQPKRSAAEEAAMSEMNVQVKRMQYWHRFLLQDEKVGLPGLLLLNCFNADMMRAELLVALEIIQEKFNISGSEMMHRTAKEIERQLAIHQMDRHVLITPLGVVQSPTDQDPQKPRARKEDPDA